VSSIAKAVLNLELLPIAVDIPEDEVLELWRLVVDPVSQKLKIVCSLPGCWPQVIDFRATKILQVFDRVLIRPQQVLKPLLLPLSMHKYADSTLKLLGQRFLNLGVTQSVSIPLQSFPLSFACDAPPILFGQAARSIWERTSKWYDYWFFMEFLKCGGFQNEGVAFDVESVTLK